MAAGSLLGTLPAQPVKRQPDGPGGYFMLSCNINPDEYVNRALKTDIRSRAPAKIECLKKRTQRFMSKMANSAHKIVKIFEIEQVRYATAIC